MKRFGRKAAAGAKTTTEDVAKQYLIADARNQFIAITINMGWRLAIAFVVPIIIGVKLDEHFKTSPAYTLSAFMLGVFASVVIIKDTIKEVNEEQAAEEAIENKGKKKSKEAKK